MVGRLESTDQNKLSNIQPFWSIDFLLNYYEVRLMTCTKKRRARIKKLFYMNMFKLKEMTLKNKFCIISKIKDRLFIL